MGRNPVCYNYRATLISYRSCLKPIDTFRGVYLDRFNNLLGENAAAMSDYFGHAPDDTYVKVSGDEEDDDEEQSEEEDETDRDDEVSEEDAPPLSASEFASRLAEKSNVVGASFGTSDGITVFRKYPLDSPLDSLPGHADNLAREVGKFFAWAWPLFQASCTGRWNTDT